ncbi:heat shock 70 kDa protein 12A-like [Crassostrea angulata]|uniref:heat shock 70 kDa protein 12A-like n=1 Tax=Magallana angulata TaxID=2784310 RepID=UPI0022B1028B|nr:heat shock 70 kDa protein 12A-like [Crassostrea angulata]
MEIMSKSTRLMVAAIQCGSTFFRFAFSLKNAWGQPFTQVWTGRSVSLITHKAPTCLLLKRDFTESLIGYEAEDKYSELEDGDNDYHFFKHFTKILRQSDIKRHTLCCDVRGRSLKAILVLEHFIRCVKKIVHQRIMGIPDDDIDYVFTVPTTGEENAKLIVREAAVNAGIKREYLAIVLESEAASIYCQYLKFAEKDTSSPVLGVVKPGTKYMLVHLESGTADITVHQKCEDNTLEEVLPASGGPWGGKAVDDQFIKFLSELVEEKVWENFKSEHMEDYLDITWCFETKKRTIKPDKSGSTRMPIPHALLKLCTKSHSVESFNEVIEKNDAHKNNVSFMSGKLVWKNDFFRGFFKKTIDAIVKHMDDIFQESEARDVKIIVMVGCFSGCPLVQDAVRKNFCNYSIIVPEVGDLAVLKGAVYSGHIPDAVSLRSARYTYGFQTWPEFNEDIHPEEKRVQCGKLSRCRDVFSKIVTKGDKIMAGFTKSQFFRVCCNRDNIVLECGLFISEKKNPMFVDDPDCKSLGTLQVPFSPNKQNIETLVEEKLFFGMTELKFTAEDIFSGLKFEISFDLPKE